MFNAIIEAVRTFDQKFLAAYNTWKKNEKQILQNYAGSLLADKISEGKNAFQGTVDQARSEALKIVDQVFLAIDTKLEAVVLAMDPDLMQMAETAQRIGSNISAIEADLFMKTVSGNYLASVAMAAALEKHGFKVNLVRYEIVSERLENMKARVYAAINEQMPESYNAKIIYADDNLLIKFDEDILKPFINR